MGLGIKNFYDVVIIRLFSCLKFDFFLVMCLFYRNIGDGNCRSKFQCMCTPKDV